MNDKQTVAYLQSLIRSMLSDLPAKRDWLDPQVEKELRASVATVPDEHFTMTPVREIAQWDRVRVHKVHGISDLGDHVGTVQAIDRQVSLGHHITIDRTSARILTERGRIIYALLSECTLLPDKRRR